MNKTNFKKQYLVFPESLRAVKRCICNDTKIIFINISALPSTYSETTCYSFSKLHLESP